ncbi:MAG: pyridoxamine 5'-phosphate oxidase family protein [Clostridia bacterium]|nr:pyridoxamine 5'-phosphate oxidase family protein [Clostridia bacterium]
MTHEKSFENAIELAKSMTSGGKPVLAADAILKKSCELIDSCGIAMLASNGNNGYPNVKAMMKVETEGIKTIWFSTNTSSKRVVQLRKDPKACVYFHNEKCFKGLMLVGEIEVLSDLESKKRLWREGCEVYYPLGVDDPDYTVLKFTSKWANYYEGLQNISFDV